MKAIPRTRPIPVSSQLRPRRSGAYAGALLLLSLGALSGCAEQPPAPPTVSQPSPAEKPKPVPTPPTVENWRDAPISAGTWQWSANEGASAASFGAGQFVLTCDRRSQTISLKRAASNTSGAVPMTITTMAGARTLTAHTVPGGIEATLPSRDATLDAMAFSRGRFAVEASGLMPLFIPSWTEVSRVIEDCR